MTIERLRFHPGEAPYNGIESLIDIIERNESRWEALRRGLHDIAPADASIGYKRQIRVLRNGTGILGPSNSPSVQHNPHNPMKESQKLSSVGDVFYIATAVEPRSVTEIIFFVPGPTPKR